jgi:hypothetical protein
MNLPEAMQAVKDEMDRKGYNVDFELVTRCGDVVTVIGKRGQIVAVMSKSTYNNLIEENSP